jgi:hypothetical protein
VNIKLDLRVQQEAGNFISWATAGISRNDPWSQWLVVGQLTL